MERVKVSWSGGKDSTCAALMHIEKGDDVVCACYIPMLTEDIPLISKSHYEFIFEAAEKLKKMGAEVHIESGETYEHYVTKERKKGKDKGKIQGFPCFLRGKCGYKRDSKIKTLKNMDKIIGQYDYEDIGIAADEWDRAHQLYGKKRSILYENGITEIAAFEKSKIHGLISPKYKKGSTRDGCVLCPNGREEERDEWYEDYAGAKNKTIELQMEVINNGPECCTPLRKHAWFLEMPGMTKTKYGYVLNRDVWKYAKEIYGTKGQVCMFD